MSAEPPLPPAVVPLPALPPPVRVEYQGFQSVADHREFRFRVHGPEGWGVFRLRIASTAFGAGRLSLQEGPDVCYQKLLRTVAAGEAMGPEGITIDDVDVSSYRETHVLVPKHRSWAPSAPPSAPIVEPK